MVTQRNTQTTPTQLLPDSTSRESPERQHSTSLPFMAHKRRCRPFTQKSEGRKGLVTCIVQTAGCHLMNIVMVFISRGMTTGGFIKGTR